jgi:hypothetical protein
MAPTKGPSGPQFLVIALTALGLLVCVQVLRVTTTHSGSMSAFATRDALSLQQRALGAAAHGAARAHATLSGAVGAPAATATSTSAQLSTPTPILTLDAQQPLDGERSASSSVDLPAGLRSCKYQRASPLLPAGPHAAGVPLTDLSTCPTRSPYHTLLTAQSTTYQHWQSRIMYYHWKKQRAADGPCTDMTGFTRLAAGKGGAPDGLEALIPTIFIEQLPDEVIRTHFHFGVLNRPHSVKVLLQTPALAAQIQEVRARERERGRQASATPARTRAEAASSSSAALRVPRARRPSPPSDRIHPSAHPRPSVRASAPSRSRPRRRAPEPAGLCIHRRNRPRAHAAAA